MPITAIRAVQPEDLSGLLPLYRSAFPDEDLTGLIEALTGRENVTALIAEGEGAELLGHIALTRCTVGDETSGVALLGPLAVAPHAQRKGIGSALINAGFGVMKDQNVGSLLVLGDSEYYGRFGFERETAIAPPYPLPARWLDAWMSVALDKSERPSGTLNVPTPWRRPELWG